MQPNDEKQNAHEHVKTVRVVKEFEEITGGIDYRGNEAGYHR
jgi:hypothetical protein